MKTRAFLELVVTDYDKFNVLSKSHFCSGMSRSETLSIAPYFVPYKIEANTNIYEEGDKEGFLCIIVSGSVNVYKNRGMPTEKFLVTLGPGETVGEVSVVDEKPRSASVVSKSETILYALTRRNLIEMYNASLAVWAKLIFNISLSLCSRLRYTNEILHEAIEGRMTSESPFRAPTLNLTTPPFLKTKD